MKVFRVLLLTVLAALCGCSGEPAAPVTHPIVLVGIDGASWVAIRDLWDQDRLPHLRALADRGVGTDLQPVADISPVIWTSFVTGVSPERHGIIDFLLPTTEGDVPVSSTVRKVPAIWNMLTTLGRRVAVLGWWASWPAEEVNGVVVSDRALKIREQGVFPPEFVDRFDEVVDQIPQPLDDTLQAEIARQDEVIGELARDLLREQFDLTLVYLRGPDVVSHPYWKYFQVQDSEEVDSERIDQFGERVPLAYEAVDRIVGELVAAAPAKTNFLITSDHGFTSFRRGINLNSWLLANGYLKLKEGTDGASEWLREVDWSQTKAYALGLTGMFLNLEGRESEGIVAPGEEAEALKAELIEKISGLVDEEKGEVGIVEVFDTHKLYQGPYLGNAPDFLIGYNHGYRTSWDCATGVVAGPVFEDNTKAWSGDHCVDPRLVPGVLFCSHKIDDDDPALIDIAPTALQLFGVGVPPHMEGKPLFSSETVSSGRLKKLELEQFDG